MRRQGITPDLYLGHVVEELRQGKIVPILPGWERQNWNMHILARRDRYLSDPVIRDFVNWFSQVENKQCVERIMQARSAIEEARSKGFAENYE